jgi:hypothetical protein
MTGILSVNNVTSNDLDMCLVQDGVKGNSESCIRGFQRSPASRSSLSVRSHCQSNVLYVRAIMVCVNPGAFVKPGTLSLFLIPITSTEYLDLKCDSPLLVVDFTVTSTITLQGRHSSRVLLAVIVFF